MVKLIAIVDLDFGISKDNGIPWSFSKDLEFFKQKTEGQVVLMGRKTFFSIPNHPLKNRINCVVSKTEKYIEGAEVFGEIESAIDKYKDLWVIGGEQVYNYVLRKDLVNYLLLTIVKRRYGADKFLDKEYIPENNLKTILENEFYKIEECYI